MGPSGGIAAGSALGADSAPPRPVVDVLLRQDTMERIRRVTALDRPGRRRGERLGMEDK